MSVRLRATLIRAMPAAEWWQKETVRFARAASGSTSGEKADAARRAGRGRGSRRGGVVL